MAEYNLNKRQRQIVAALVTAYDQGYEDEFMWFPTMGSQPAVEIGDQRIRADETDLVALEREGLVTLRPTSGGYFGGLRQRAFEAVANDFSVPEAPTPSSAVNIGNYIESMTGGNVQGAAAMRVTQEQTINDPEAMVELFRTTTDQLTTTLSSLLTPQQLRVALQDVTAVQYAAEEGKADVGVFAGHVRSVCNTVLSGLDVGDKLGGTMQALMLLGPWAHMAFQLIQSSIR